MAAATSGIGLVALSAVGPAWAAPLVVAAGIGLAACDVLGRTILQRVTPDRVLARVFGALEGLGLAGLALGSILAPLIVLVLGVDGALVAFGLLLPAGIALSWLGLRAMDRQALVPRRALDLLRTVEIFAPLPPPQLEWLARQTRWMTFEPGEVVIREGDVGDAYYVLESGELRVTQIRRAAARPVRARGRCRRDRPAPRRAKDGHRHLGDGRR